MRLALSVLLLLLTACGKEDCCTEPAQISDNPLSIKGPVPGVLRKSNGTEPATLDPHRAQDVTSSNILRDLFEP